METQTDVDKLPFEEYARIQAEKGAREYLPPDKPWLTFDELVASELTPEEIETQYGEETSINVGIARDPDAPEWTDEDFARARPASEVHPELVARYLRTRGKQKTPTKESISIRLDADIVTYFRSTGPGWQTRLNDKLRQDVFGS